MIDLTLAAGVGAPPPGTLLSISAGLVLYHALSNVQSGRRLRRSWFSIGATTAAIGCGEANRSWFALRGETLPSVGLSDVFYLSHFVLAGLLQLPRVFGSRAADLGTFLLDCAIVAEAE